MKNLLTVFVLALAGLFISTISVAQNRSVEFEHSKWSKVLKKAKKEKNSFLLTVTHRGVVHVR